MTWVIGIPGFLFRGVLVGDTRITLRDPGGRRPNREIEGVQKVHAIAGNVAMGFAGNIETGFRMVAEARWNLNHGMLPGLMLTQPSRFLLHWRRRVRWLWQNHLTERDRAGGLALLWMGALPAVADAGFTPTRAWILSSPDFEPEPIPSRTARSIGSGAHVAEYIAELEAVRDEWPNLIQFEIGPWQRMGGPGFAISISVSDAIERHAAPGVSPHLVICSVGWGAVEFRTNGREGLSAGALSRVMPPIARDWAEWQEFKRQHGLADLLAVA